MLVMSLRIGASREAAMERARPGHDELRKLIWPNIVNKNLPWLAGRRRPWGVDGAKVLARRVRGHGQRRTARLA
jgi:hypothetical protein